MAFLAGPEGTEKARFLTVTIDETIDDFRGVGPAQMTKSLTIFTGVSPSSNDEKRNPLLR